MRSRNVSIKWRGREVHNPVLRKLVAGFLLLMVPVMFVLFFIALFVLAPLMLVLHLVFRLFGLNGTYQNDNGHVLVTINRNSFRRK